MRRLALAAIAALAAACGDDGGDSYETLVPATAEEFLALLPVVRCQQLVRCGAYTSMDRCVATIGTSTGSAWPRASRVTFDRWWQAGIARGTVAYSPGDAALCLASFGRGTCSAAVEALVDTTVCDGVLRGTLQTGETSTYPHECASLSWGPGPHCSYTTECCRETCSDERSFPPPFAPAEPCSSDAACGARRSCHEGFCMRGVAEGAACETSADCWSALICRGGRCVTAEPPPNECEQEGSAPSYACDRYGTSCDRSVMSCRPLGDLGDDCRGGELPCKRDLVCGDTSRCQLPPGLGERCSTRCGPDLVCSWTTEPWTCVAAGALADGEPCVLDDECSSGFCDRYADGQPRCAMPLACP